MSSASIIYDKLYDSARIEKAESGIIQDHIVKIYNRLSNQLDGMSLTDFAATQASFCPTKSGLGEKAQIEALRQNKRFININSLPKQGKESISLWYDKNNIIHMMKKVDAKKLGLNLVKGTKTFDAIENQNILILKTIDFGSSSKSRGGGTQTNAINELITTINAVGNKTMTLNKTPMHISIVIDSRESEHYINICKKYINTTSITIGTSDSI